MPNKTGSVTIKNILIAIPVKEIEPRESLDINPMERPSTKGTEITLNKLITAVKEIDKATSPFANEVRIFDVTPPGAAAINIKPMASSGCRGQMKTIIKATNGRNISWLISPIKKFFGIFAKRAKSEEVRPSPKVNIIKAKARGRITSVMEFIINDNKYKNILISISNNTVVMI